MKIQHKKPLPSLIVSAQTTYRSNTTVQASLITNSKGELYYFYSMFEFKSTATLTLTDKTLDTNTTQVNTTEAPQTKSSNSHFAVITSTFVGMTF